MSSYEKGLLAKFGYSSSHGCGKARLCPAFSLPDLFSEPGAAGAGSGKLSAAQINGLLKAIPAYFSQDVISPDRNAATLAFGVRQMSLASEQKRHRRDALAAAPARRCERQPRRPARDGGGLGCRRRRPVAAPGHAAGRARRRRAGARAGLPRRRPPRARAARAGGARLRLVGADPVRRAGAAEPAVGHARRARDRDLDRVQRAAQRARSSGAPGRATGRSRRCVAPISAPERRWPPRRSRRSPASGCSCSRKSTCCASSASSP